MQTMHRRRALRQCSFHWTTRQAAALHRFGDLLETAVAADVRGVLDINVHLTGARPVAGDPDHARVVAMQKGGVHIHFGRYGALWAVFKA